MAPPSAITAATSANQIGRNARCDSWCSRPLRGVRKEVGSPPAPELLVDGEAGGKEAEADAERISHELIDVGSVVAVRVAGGQCDDDGSGRHEQHDDRARAGRGGGWVPARDPRRPHQGNRGCGDDRCCVRGRQWRHHGDERVQRDAECPTMNAIPTSKARNRTSGWVRKKLPAPALAIRGTVSQRSDGTRRRLPAKDATHVPTAPDGVEVIECPQRAAGLRRTDVASVATGRGRHAVESSRSDGGVHVARGTACQGASTSSRNSRARG